MDGKLKEFRDWVDVAFKIVLAISGILIGWYFSHQKQQNDDIQLIVDLSTSPDAQKRAMGSAIVKTYLRDGRIPQEIVVSLADYAAQTGDDVYRAAVNGAVVAAAAQQPKLALALKKSSEESPARIYLHIRAEDDRATAKGIGMKAAEALSSKGSFMVIPGIEFVKGAQTKTLLKCFKKAECAILGPTLVEGLKAAGENVELVDLSREYEDSTAIRPKHFEVWFAEGLKNRTK